MLDVLFADTRAKADAWEASAADRRRISRVDPVADTLLLCARELRTLVASLEHGVAYLTPEQYGALCVPPRAAQTVTRWIRRGELAATETPTGWMIRRSAVRRRATA